MSSEPQDPHPEILQALFGYLERFPTKVTTLTAQTDLAADLNLDSVNMMELLMQIEDDFDLSLPLNRMANVNTVQDLADLVTQLVEERS